MKIYNPFSRFFSEKNATKPRASQIEPTSRRQTRMTKDVMLNNLGGSGTPLYRGILSEEYNTNLTGEAGMRIYDSMRKGDAQVFATLFACELPIRSTKWFIDSPTDENGEAINEEVTEFVRQALFEKMKGTTWDNLLFEILSMLAFGFSVFEKVYTSDGKNIWLKDLASRKQTTIGKWEQEDGTAGVTQYLSTPLQNGKNEGRTHVSIPAEKLVVFSFRREGNNYEGVSLLRSSYANWKYKTKFYLFDAIRQERLSVGIPVIYLPENASEEDKEEALNIVSNVRVSETTGVVIPAPKSSGWEFEFVDTHADKSTNIFESIKYHNRQISKNILLQFLELGATESGSRNLGEDQSKFFFLAMTALANQIADVFNRFVIPELVDLNFDVEQYPKLKFDKLGHIDFKELSETLKNLADSDVLEPDENLEAHIRDKMNLPAKPNEETKHSSKKETVSKKESIDEDLKEEVKANEELFTDEDFLKISKQVNNKFIVDLQNECREGQDYATLKAKGFKFNDYEKKAPRPLTFTERKVNFTSLKRSMDTFDQILSEKVGEITAKQKEDLLNQVKKAVENNDIRAVGTIKAKYTNELSQALTDVQKELFEIGKKTASTEMNVKVPPTKAEVRGAMRIQNDAIVAGLVSNMETSAKTTVTELASKKGGEISQVGTTEAVGAVSTNLDKTITKAKNTMDTLGITGAVNMGRTVIFERYPTKIYGFQYSAILDERTTDTCRSLDGRVVKTGSQAYYDYSPPRHYNCRSIWVEVLHEETYKPKFTGIPSKIPANSTIQSHKKLEAPVLLKSSPAVKQVKEELEERKGKLLELENLEKFPNRQVQHKKRIDQLEKSLANLFYEQSKGILKSDGVKFKSIMKVDSKKS